MNGMALAFIACMLLGLLALAFGVPPLTAPIVAATSWVLIVACTGPKGGPRCA